MIYPDLRPQNYQRAFFFKKLGYLLNDGLVLPHYKKRDFIALYSHEALGTYIGNSAAEWAGQNGKDIFSSERNFKEFEAGFRVTTDEAENYISKAQKLTTVTFNDFVDLQSIVCKLYYYFEKTEFFFTDASYKGEMSEILKKNLLVLGDDLKMRSRPILVELMTSVLYHFVSLSSVRFGVDEEDLKFYSFDEIRALFELEQRVSPETIKDRQESFVLYCEDGKIISIEGKDKREVLERFEEEDHSNKKEFKGTVANKGKVTARVRVVLPELNIPYQEFVKKLYSMEMNQGDILVTETTSPDFVPLMKKAGGIIANQGGLNSHAAIMSRELGIPCLVATYHATDILKTGDMIELDAEKGIVTILKNKL